MPTNDLKFLQEFVIERAVAEPLPTQERLYRALAESAQSAVFTNRFMRLAEEIHDIQTRHHQLLLDFRNAR